jgi:hypothetical protein
LAAGGSGIHIQHASIPTISKDTSDTEDQLSFCAKAASLSVNAGLYFSFEICLDNFIGSGWYSVFLSMDR